MSDEDNVVNTEEDAPVPTEEHKEDVEQPEETKEEDFNEEPTKEDNTTTNNEEKTDNEERKEEEDNNQHNVEENKEDESKEDDLKVDTTENNNEVNEQSSVRTSKSPKSHTTHSVTTYLDPEAPLPSHLPQKNSPENKEKLANYSYNPNDTGVTERPSCFADLKSPEKPYKSNEKHKTIAELLNPNPPQKINVKTIMKEQRKNIDKIYQTKLEFSNTSPRAKGNNNKKGGNKKTKSKSPRRK